jgi:hypothetical protein
MRMSCEAFDIYLNGMDKAFQLLDNLMKMQNLSKFIQVIRKKYFINFQLFY